MQESPLLRTMQLLNPEEFETLALFVESPIFNEVNRFQDTVRLFTYLQEHYPHFQSPALVKNVVGKKLFPTRSKPENEVERTMAQLMHIVKQFINFRYSAVKDGRVVRGGRKTNITQDPVALLNFARQQLALMRFYSERLLQKPIDAPDVPGPARPEPTPKGKQRRVKKTEYYFQSLYQELQSVFEEEQQFSLFEEYEYSDFFYFRYLAEQEKAIYESLHEWTAKGGINNLLVASENLDRFYMLGKLDQICKLLHLQQMAIPFSEDSDEYRRLKTNQKLTIKMVKLLVKHNYHVDDPGIDIYFTLLQLLSKKTPEKTDPLADQFFTLLQQHRDLVPARRFKDFNIIVRSYWARRYRQTRDRSFLEKLFRSHQEDIEQLRRNKENIQSSHFQNTLFNAIKLGHLDWAAAFLKEFAPKISAAPEPELVADIGYAMFHFAQKQHKEAEKRLPHYFNYGASDDPTLYSLAATLDIRIRYELGNLLDPEGVNMRRATQKRIRENKLLPPDRQAGILGFYEVSLRLFRLREKLQLQQSVNCTSMRQELDDIHYLLTQKPTVDHEWLQEKCNEIRALLKKKCPKTGSK
ncbi:MAG: hypothetical protein H6574_02915 [Lewinellaceae bacterium]|nr:hypothetical protein [Saprospiraceae bacterium]MCB9330008.1 hypothetical protein [Lewinellaceae bacterium]